MLTLKADFRQHVVTPFSYPCGMPEGGHEMTARDLDGQVIQWAQKDLDEVLLPQLEGIAVTRVLLRGDPATEIVEAARFHDAGLIVMSTRGEGALYRMMLRSVTAKVPHETSGPIWIGAHAAQQPNKAETPSSGFSVRRILFPIALNLHNRYTLARAAGQTQAEGLIVGHIPGRSHPGDNGIIRESRVPVLSV